MSDPRGAVSFIQACGHASLDPPTLEALHRRGLELDERDWNEVLGNALVERMECLTYAHAAAAGLLPIMPDRIRETFSSVYRGTLVTNLKMRNGTLALLEALAEQGVRAACVKGVALALRCYREIAHRPMGDIDLLVSWPDIEASATVLAKLGFRPIPGMRTPRFPASEPCARFRASRRPREEIHWSLTGLPPYARRLEATDIWGRLHDLRIKDRVVQHLHPYDELRYLCFHYAAQHQAQRLIWLVDIAELLPSPGDATKRSTLALGCVRLGNDLVWAGVASSSRARSRQAFAWYRGARQRARRSHPCSGVAARAQGVALRAGPPI